MNWYVRNRLYLHFNRKSQTGHVLKYAPNFYSELQAMGYIGFNGGGNDMSKIPHGEPYAGKLHVRFDEGADVPDEGRPALLYTLLGLCDKTTNLQFSQHSLPLCASA